MECGLVAPSQARNGPHSLPQLDPDHASGNLHWLAKNRHLQADVTTRLKDTRGPAARSRRNDASTLEPYHLAMFSSQFSTLLSQQSRFAKPKAVVEFKLWTRRGRREMSHHHFPLVSQSAESALQTSCIQTFQRLQNGQASYQGQRAQQPGCGDRAGLQI